MTTQQISTPQNSSQGGVTIGTMGRVLTQEQSPVVMVADLGAQQPQLPFPNHESNMESGAVNQSSNTSSTLQRNPSPQINSHGGVTIGTMGEVQTQELTSVALVGDLGTSLPLLPFPNRESHGHTMDVDMEPSSTNSSTSLINTPTNDTTDQTNIANAPVPQQEAVMAQIAPSAAQAIVTIDLTNAVCHSISSPLLPITAVETRLTKLLQLYSSVHSI